ncbi:MucR family transcriptional regulator [Mesorhizobium sp. VK22B]|uniref:MucR family transcriptional regulator n=1 Tax=Mesorhizobium captivum TaxID=3072319 RepID=A0ABU4ZA37_9HYPH|nr:MULTISPECIES: MucR family transcriptional regulator [unclassified Mesorhizobium]MDX8495155.1 MucR family transcriptional regulator [Mesorhizobium sp. VK22B]MDX8505692.1 MucR family transcriptional regulator [Mesorhizobium sp. VK22E]
MSDEKDTILIELTADIVSAYVQKNSVPVSGLPDLIASVNSALSNIGKPATLEAPELKPAVNPKRSVFPDYIISLEDGKRYKSLKRHLSANYGLTPDEYRAKWGLAKDYPMVAPSYSATRSALAKSLGLGRKVEKAPKTKASRARNARG